MKRVSNHNTGSSSPVVVTGTKLFGQALIAGLAITLASTGCGPIDPWDWFPDHGGSGGSPPSPPVCELDGEVYAVGDSFPAPDGCNTCFCDEAGGIACTERACLNPCGGLLGLACPEGQFCRFSVGDFCGAADQTGLCATPPEACDDHYEPVCGCDGQTYGNECAANASGVSAATSGECGDPSAECETDDDCTFQCREAGNECPELVCEAGRCVEEPQGSCEVNGIVYQPGESFPSPDGCNTCTCSGNGLIACTLRACVDTCGGLQGLECPEGQFCRYQVADACGAADQAGSCTTPPEACTEQYQPVCGCDGNTYSNDCFAHAAGVSVASEGTCEPPPLKCNSDDDCPIADCIEGVHCPAYVCREGFCVDVAPPPPPPAECETDSDCPVINCLVAPCPQMACEAGLCLLQTAPTDTCGPEGERCAEDEFCALPFCGAAAESGECVGRPELCTFQYDPVCGCNGETYGNACAAASAGVNVAASGECQELGEGDSCGGFRPPGSAECGEGLFCQHQPGALCGAADAPGLCVAIPETCGYDEEPVCGCDGNTYRNACWAAEAQVGLLETGKCAH